MNRNQTQDNARQMTGKVTEKRRKLTHDDLTVIAGVRDQLAGILQERYGCAKAQSEE